MTRLMKAAPHLFLTSMALLVGCDDEGAESEALPETATEGAGEGAADERLDDRAEEPAPNDASFELTWGFVAEEARNVDSKAFVQLSRFPGTDEMSFSIELIPAEMNPTCDTQLDTQPLEGISDHGIALRLSPPSGERFEAIPEATLSSFDTAVYYVGSRGAARTEIRHDANEATLSLEITEVTEHRVHGSFSIAHPNAPRGRTGGPGATLGGEFVAEICHW